MSRLIILDVEPGHDILVLITSATNQCSDKPAQQCSLARPLAAHIQRVWIPQYACIHVDVGSDRT